MGLFSNKKETYVGSSAYNLAGEYDFRKKRVLPSLVLASVLSNSRAGIGITIRNGVFNSSLMMQRRFFKWAVDRDFPGLPTGAVTEDRQADTATVKSGVTPLLDLDQEEFIEIYSAVIDSVDEEYWAEEWVVKNRPDLIGQPYVTKYLPNTQQIRIDFSANVFVVIPAPADMLWLLADRTRKLLYVVYSVLSPTGYGLYTRSEKRLFTYRMGTGNVVLDSLMPGDGAELEEFFPTIPMKIYKNWATDLPDAELWEKGYRKLTGGKIEDLIEQIDENPGTNKIDFAFLVMGVSLNTEDQSARLYLYEFFRKLMDFQSSSVTLNEIIKKVAKVAQDNTDWRLWIQGNTGDNYTGSSYGSTPPQQEASYTPPVNELRVKCLNPKQFDYRIRWTSIRESMRSGNAGVIHGKEALKRGEILLEGKDNLLKVGSLDTVLLENNSLFGGYDLGTVLIHHQMSQNQYRTLTIEGLVHRNYVYDGKSVDISGVEALKDKNESSFILPLHYPTVKALGVRHGIQMATANAYLVFNSYEVVTTQWWQRGLFRVILVIATVAVTAFTGGAAAAAAGGILGNNLVVGLSLGLSGSVAVVAGAVANALAAMVLTTLLSQVSSAVFGERWGAILGAVISFVAMTYAVTYATTGSFHVDWGKLMNTRNLMNITNSVSKGYAQFLHADAREILAEIEELRDSHEKDLKRIQKLSAEILGMTDIAFDPMMLLDANEYFGESPSDFLQRTLLTGSDLAELSMAMIEDYTEMSLELAMAPV